MKIEVKSVSLVLGVILTIILIGGFLFQGFSGYHSQFATTAEVKEQYQILTSTLDEILINQLQQEIDQIKRDAANEKRPLSRTEKKTISDNENKIREIRGY